MNTEIKNRLEELKLEYRKGQERLTVLEKETTNLSHTLLRISGAIQVLEELTGTVDTADDNGVGIHVDEIHQ